MNPFKRHPGTLLLGFACLLAACGLGLEYRLLQRTFTGTLQPPATPVEPAQIPELPNEALVNLPPIEGFSAFLAQPLFIEGRKPLPEEATTTHVPEADKQSPTVHLTGIIAAPEAGQIILVQDQHNKTLRFKPGETIDGWRVAALKEDQVILERDGETHVLKLIKPRPVQPPPAARPSPPQAQTPNPFLQAAEQKKE